MFAKRISGRGEDSVYRNPPGGSAQLADRILVFDKKEKIVSREHA